MNQSSTSKSRKTQGAPARAGGASLESAGTALAPDDSAASTAGASPVDPDSARAAPGGKPKAGRPRTFCAEQALDSAMRVFWEKGYEGSTLPELTRAMGMNRPSLYAVFGNKEQLFHKALERYNATRVVLFDAAMEQPTSRGVVERLLTLFVDAQTEPESPHGCLGINGAVVCRDDVKPIRDELAANRFDNEIKLRQRLQRAVAEGDLPADASAEQLARYVMTVSQGMALQANAGVTRTQLHEVIAMVLRGWPS